MELIAEVGKPKRVAAQILVEEVQPSGIGDLFVQNKFEITEEEINTRSYVSAGGGDPVWDSLTGQMIEASPAFMAQELLTGPPEEPYNGKFIIGQHHEEWDQLVTQYDRICILAARDHGKCQRGDALILTPSGKRVRIDEWEGGMLWAYDIKTHELVETYAPASRPNGVKPGLRVRTKSGREVVVTENHPLRLLDSWRRADELEVGQRIAVSYKSPTKANKTMGDAWLVGLLIGDGGLTGSNVILTTADSNVLQAVRSLGIETRRADKHSHRLLKMQPRMRELNLMGHTGHTKRVPAQLFECGLPSIADFISGYLDADATVNKHGGGAVEFYSVSELLLRDVQHLLTRLGILAVLSPKLGKYKGEDHHSWRLTIRGKDLITLYNVINPRGTRKEQLKAIVATQREKELCSGPAIDRYPREVWGMFKNTGNWFKRNGLPRPAKGYEPTRVKLQTMAAGEDNVDLLALVNSDILWDEVVDIECLGDDETWSIHVPGYENYLADDIVNHNTFFFDFAVPIWKAINMPGGIGFIFSATQPQAKRILGDIRHEIETNPRLQWLVPARRDQWSSTVLRMSNGHTIYARGFGTKVRGAHPNWIIVDDGLNDESAYSELVRKKQIDYFYTAITNMIVPGGQIIVVGTPFSTEDLYFSLKKNSEYKFAKSPAIRKGSDGADLPLWSSRYPLDALYKRRREIGSVKFTREFLCDPISDEMSLFPSHLFMGNPTEQPLVKLGAPKEFWDEVGVEIYMGIDIAMSTSAQADYFVIWTMGRDKFGNRWIIDIERDRGIGFQEQLSMINTTARKYDPALILIEANQMQRVWGDELIRTTDLPIKKFVTTAQNKNALDTGLPSLRILLENQKFRIPRGDARSVKMTNIWVDEMRNFTWDKGKIVSVGGHDDTGMALWICDQAIRMGSFNFSFEGDPDDDDADALMAEMTGEDIDDDDGGDDDNSGKDAAFDRMMDDMF